VARARAAAGRLAEHAARIDETGVIPDELVEPFEPEKLWADGQEVAAQVLEEVAVASASVAARLALGSAPRGGAFPGLRGVAAPERPTDRQRLAVAAVCVGIGRAAIDAAVSAIKHRGERPSGSPSESPHWVLADAATEVSAARLLVRTAAGEPARWSAAALVFAAGAARRAVDAAGRNVGRAAFDRGSPLERLARDARAAENILGTEDDGRRAAAAALLDAAESREESSE
jgi:hypothetical protein